MEQIGNMKFYSHDEVSDEIWGKIGTPKRDAMEAQLKEDINAWHVGEAIKKARLQQNLTQEQLGEMMGVKKSQVCRIESGKNLTFSTIARAFKALGVVASLDMPGVGKVALW